MSVVPLLASCPIMPSSAIRDTLLALFRGLQHPYIHPVLDIEFWEASVALVTPLNPIGSLRDLIYGCSWQQDYDRKYNVRGVGLPLRQVGKTKFYPLTTFYSNIYEGTFFYPKELLLFTIIFLNYLLVSSKLEKRLFYIPDWRIVPTHGQGPCEC